MRAASTALTGQPRRTRRPTAPGGSCRFGSGRFAQRTVEQRRQQLCQRSWLRMQCSSAWYRSYQHRRRLCTFQQLARPPVVARSAGCRRRDTRVHAGVRCARALVCELVMSAGKKKCSVTGSDPIQTRPNITQRAQRAPSRAPLHADQGDLWCKQLVPLIDSIRLANRLDGIR